MTEQELNHGPGMASVFHTQDRVPWILGPASFSGLQVVAPTLGPAFLPFHDRVLATWNQVPDVIGRSYFYFPETLSRRGGGRAGKDSWAESGRRASHSLVSQGGRHQVGLGFLLGDIWLRCDFSYSNFFHGGNGEGKGPLRWMWGVGMDKRGLCWCSDSAAFI